MLKFWVMGVSALALIGCSSLSIDRMNHGLASAMGQNVSQLQSALGEAVETSSDSGQTKYRWFAESHIEPCQIEVWADADGVVRKTAWSGYEVACREFAEGLNRVFPTQ